MLRNYYFFGQFLTLTTSLIFLVAPEGLHRALDGAPVRLHGRRSHRHHLQLVDAHGPLFLQLVEAQRPH